MKIKIVITREIPSGEYCLKCSEQAYIRRRQKCTLFKEELRGYGKGLVKCKKCIDICKEQGNISNDSGESQ